MRTPVAARTSRRWFSLLFFFNDTATTEIYTLSLHDALPIYAYAFGERDIIALERLAEMIQTALEHAEAARRAEKIGEQAVEKKQTANGAEAGANSPIEEKA